MYLDMSILEQQISNILADLKNVYGVSQIKCEFGEESTTFEEAARLKEIVSNAGMDLVVKVGGCEAVNDVSQAKNLEASIIVSPMIETPYALEKYIKSIKSVYEENEATKFMINVETITGFNNFEKMAKLPEFALLSGIVLGRDDMACSLGLTQNEVNNSKILEISKELSLKVEAAGKDFIIGGGVNSDSLSFLKSLPYLTRFETRKVIFNSSLIWENIAESGLKRALEFEIMWLKYKSNCAMSKRDELRLKNLQERLNLIHF